MKDLILLGVGGFVVIGVAYSQIPAMRAKADARSIAGAEARTNLQNTAKLNAIATAEAEEAKIANARYQGHCEPVAQLTADIGAAIPDRGPIVAGAYAKQFAAKPDRKYFMPSGASVCDFHGKTAVMVHDAKLGYAVTDRIAVTRDEQVIQAFRDKHKHIVPQSLKNTQ